MGILNQVADIYSNALQKLGKGDTASTSKKNGSSPEKKGGGPETWDNDKLLKQVKARYEEARRHRYMQNAMIFNGLAMFANQQYDRYDSSADDGAGGLAPANGAVGDQQNQFHFKQYNYIRVLIEQAAAYLSSEYPDAWPAPMTSEEKDKLCAQVARSVVAHSNRLTGRKQLIDEAILGMMIMSTMFIEVGWDGQHECDMAIPQPDGTIAYKEIRGGEVFERLRLPVDCYPDPNAALSPKGIHGGEFFIVKECLHKDYVRRKWGKVVEPTMSDGTYGSLLQRIEWIANEYGKTATRGKTHVEVTTMWELPSWEYPKGRLTISAPNEILWKGWWPYEKKDSYPFEGFYLQKNFGSVWGLNLAKILTDPQDSINQIETYTSGRAQWDCPVQHLPESCNVSPEGIINRHYGMSVPYDDMGSNGNKPSWDYPPPVGDFYDRQRIANIQAMEYLAGVKGISSTANPPSSGYEKELQMFEDRSRLGPVFRRICESVCRLDEWVIALYRQYGASFDRLLALDDRGVTEAIRTGGPGSSYTSLQALQDGRCRVYLQPGSGIARLPMAQEQLILDVCKASVGMPSPLVHFMLDEIQSIRSDSRVDKLIKGLEAMEAQKAQNEQPAPLVQLQQMRGEQELAVQKAKTEAALQNAQIEAHLSAEKAAIQEHQQQQDEQARLRTDMLVEDQRFQNAIKVAQVKNSTPSVSLSGTINMDPQGLRSAEAAAGLEPGSIDDIKKGATSNGKSPTGASPNAD